MAITVPLLHWVLKNDGPSQPPDPVGGGQGGELDQNSFQNIPKIASG